MYRLKLAALLVHPVQSAAVVASLVKKGVSRLIYLGRSGPNLKPGTIWVCGMNSSRKGMHTT